LVGVPVHIEILSDRFSVVDSPLIDKRATMTTRKKKKVSSLSTSTHDDIFLMRVEPEEIIYLVEELAKLHEEGRESNWYSQVAILLDRYPKQASRAHCIMQRMHCLAALAKDDRMRGWSMATDDPKCALTHEARFRATAKARLYPQATNVRFDADEFFALVLDETPSEGNA
jgi:hypothetical protein